MSQRSTQDGASDVPAGAAATPGRGDRSIPTRREPGASVRRRRWRRRGLIALPLLAVVLWLAVSYTSYMVMPTSETWSERSAEWVRNDVPYGNWMVDEGEHVYYTWNAPKRGGPQLTRLPRVGVSARVAPRHAAPAARAAVWPLRIRPVFAHPLPGEGVWRSIGPPVHGGPPVLITTYRPDPSYPRTVAYVAWFDHTRTELAYYPGRYEPPHAADRGPRTDDGARR